jgi:GT2 family glycosyltransferase
MRPKKSPVKPLSKASKKTPLTAVRRGASNPGSLSQDPSTDPLSAPSSEIHPTPPIRIAVVVLNYKGLDDTLKCVEALFDQTFESYHIYLIDNGSEDGSKERLSQIRHEKLTFFANKRNDGFTGGVNIGITWALQNDFDAVALLNNDAVPEKNWLSELVKGFAQSEEIGAVTSLLLNEDGSLIDDAGDVYSTWGVPMLRAEGQEAGKAPESGLIFGGTGGATLYKAEVFRKIGLFDSKFFAYDEDVDISWRAQLAGFKFWYQKSAVAFHKHSATSSKMPGFTVYQTVKNLPLVLWKNVPSQLFAPIFIRFVVAYFLYLVFQTTKGNFLPALKGFLRHLTLLPHCFIWRSRIQKSKVVSDVYIKSILHKGLPFKQVRRLKGALFFWKKG